MIKLYSYQQEAVDFIGKNRYSYISLPPGGGKTLTALHTTRRFRYILIICPASLCQLWADEIFKWYQQDAGVFIFNQHKQCVINFLEIIKDLPVNFKNPTYIIISYDLLLKIENYKLLFKWQYEAVIVDEAHHLKNKDSKRTQALLGWQSEKPRILTKRSAKKVILLSGTPLMNRPIEIYAVARGLVPKLLGDQEDEIKFGIKFCRGYKDIFGHWNFRGANHIEELAEKLNKFIFRVSRLRVEKELPPIQHRIVRFMCSSSLLQEELPYHKKSLVETTSWIGIEGLSEIAHRMALEKVPYVFDYCKNLLESEEKIIIFFWHTAVGEFLYEKLKSFTPILIDGRIEPNKRKPLADAYNLREKAIAICQIRAAGEGLSFHTATHVIFAENSWNPAENEQAFKRVHRRGQLNHVDVHYLVLKNTLDDYKLTKLMGKEDMLNTFYSSLEENIDAT